ncbi:MAG: glycosyltransferase family 9 protein [Ignavibacteriaceae bacterium]|jgi:heptosyltransferase-2|nr:glycosyltransferase family 9 protein [Ignavibacteriaceae bacterium]HPO55174.1 glycosyltransferase family 9 protein [Ignavibacteriaceae bacterium]
MLGQDERNVLIIRLSSLGDVLLTTPLIRSLKSKYPDINVDFVVKRQYSMVLKGNPYLRRIFFPDEEIDVTQYDVIVDLQNNLRSCKIRRKFEKRVVKFKKYSLDKYLLVNFKVNRLRELPAIPVRYAETVEKGLLDESGLDLLIPDSVKSRLTGDKQTIGICPGSRHFTKRYPAEKFIEVGNKLASEGFRVVVIGGEDEKNICAEISDSINGAINLSTENDLYQIAADMKRCDGIICNDSGLMHVACAVKVPVVVIFGSSVREFGFTPYGNKHKVVERENLSCRPCSHIGKEKCPEKHFRCMLEISSEEVIKCIKSIIKYD